MMECEEDTICQIIYIVSIVVPVVTAILIITAVSVGLGCWCYRRKQRKRERACLIGKGSIIVLSDDLEPSNEERSVVRMLLLDSVKVFCSTGLSSIRLYYAFI